MRVRVLRGSHTVLDYRSSVGQLFPGSELRYQIPWPGFPTPGTYRVQGIVVPQGAPDVTIRASVRYSPAKAAALARETPPARETRPAATGLPGWVGPVLALAGILVLALSFAVYRLTRSRPQRGR